MLELRSPAGGIVSVARSTARTKEEAWIRLDWLLARTGDPRGAERAFVEALARAPADERPEIEEARARARHG